MASSKVKTFEDANAVLAEWIARDRGNYEPIHSDEVCQRSYADLIGVSADTAADILELYVKDGTWTKRCAMVNGKRGIAYKPKGKPRAK